MGLEPQARTPATAVVLVTLAVCALSLAQGTVELFATTYLPFPPMAGRGPTPAAEAAAAATPGSTPPDVTAILARNIFDSQTGPLWPPTTAPGPPAGAPGTDGAAGQALQPGEMPPPCDGGTRLVASTYTPDRPAWSLATLSTDTGPPLLYRNGAQVGRKLLSAIYPNAVFLLEGDVLCSLTLFEHELGGPGPARPPKKPPPGPRDDPAGPPTPPGQITKLDDTHFRVDRELVEHLLSDQAALMGLTRVVPHKRNGRVVGVKLYGIRARSVLGQLGLENGDLLRTVNGYDVASPDSALEAYTRLRSADQLSLAVDRRGRDLTLGYRIE